MTYEKLQWKCCYFWKRLWQRSYLLFRHMYSCCYRNITGNAKNNTSYSLILKYLLTSVFNGQIYLTYVTGDSVVERTKEGSL